MGRSGRCPAQGMTSIEQAAEIRMPLSDATLAEVCRYWASFFGRPVAALDHAGVQVVPHAELEHYRGLFCLRHAATTLVSVPPDRVRHWQAQLAPLVPDELFASSEAR